MLRVLAFLIGSVQAAQTQTDSRPTSSAPEAEVLDLRVEAIDLPNPSLRIDDGVSFDVLDTEGGNGQPDGWRTVVQSGSLEFSAGPILTDTPSTHLRLLGETRATVTSAPIPADAGETFVLRWTVDTLGRTEVDATFGLIFKGDEGVIDWVLRPIVASPTEPTVIEARATAPPGTRSVAARIQVPEGAREAELYFTPLVLERIDASSNRKKFPLSRIILVTVETLRADHTSLHGYPRQTTPNLDALAEQGAHFTLHGVQAPWTRSSVASLMTSRLPITLGVHDNIDVMPLEVVTLAERFEQAGYVTAAFVAQYVLANKYNFNQGFHSFYAHRNETPASQIVEEALDWLHSRQDDNVFVWLHLFEPHGPYRPPTEWVDTFQDDALYVADETILEAGTRNRVGAFVPTYVLDEGQTERRHYVAAYDQEILAVDAMIGRLWEGLRDPDEDQDSLLVVTADHGESMTDHDRFFAHGSLYEHDLHVPLVLWAPGRIAPGTQVSNRTRHLDLGPTLLDLASVPVDPNHQGVSLVPLLNGEARDTEFAVAVSGRDEDLQYAVVEGDFKVILDARFTPIEAYNLARDPTESINVLDQRLGRARRLADRFERWLMEILGHSEPIAPAGRPELTAEEESALRALGYLE
ncbi:MAG: sulfatase-like hydrolase/transferase [Myxococcota bacterium]|nr:sulfatase-like hydrolase/transferase [Myxococcota bacterium]